MRMVRARASEFGVQPDRIGVMGFSAGGENASIAAFGTETGNPNAVDPVDRVDQHPNFAIWIYPGPLGVPETIPVDAPPAFMAVASDDGLSAVVLSLAGKYHAAHRPMEVHIFASGGHGFNMGDRFPKNRAVNTWPQRLADWLHDAGWLSP